MWADMAVDAAENYRGAVAKDAGITSDDSMYSIRRTSNMSWGQQIRSALKHNGKIQHMDTLVVMSNTPAYLLTGNTVNLPMAIPLSVITKAQKGKNADHAISDKNLIALQYGMENAIAVIDNPGRNSLAFITSLDEDGGKVAVFFDKNVQFDGDQVNKATSIHRRTNIVGLMNNLSDDATIYVKNKNEFDAIVGMADSIPAAYKGKIKFVYDRISHEENSVKLFSDRYSQRQQDQQAALEKQNGKLREDVERLRELLKLQGKTTGGKLFKPESIKTAANFILRETGRSLDADGKAEFAGILTNAYTALSDENVTYDDIECTNAAQWLDENGETQDALDEYAGGILSQMKGIPIRLPNKNAAITNRDKCLERNGSIFCLLGSRILHIKYAHNHNTGKGYGNAGVVLPAQLLF